MESGEGASLTASSCSDARKRRVSYFYEPTIGDYYFGYRHPMKPLLIRMTHKLIESYSLHQRMEICCSIPATAEDMGQFHTAEYFDFLSSVSPETMRDENHAPQLKRFNIGADRPVFDGICQASAGGSIGAAVMLNNKDADIAINWAGGLHHAKKGEVSGILELLKVHRRVLYIDIDIHHGDGVEEAFYTTNRVMTVSFHKFGNFFSGTGHIEDIGVESGKYYSLNVPLSDKLTEDNLRSIFCPIIQKVMDVYQPEAVVLQCGADSLAGDRLGSFNLSVHGHADCLRFLRSFNVPLLLLGGGGYTFRNVARCWCYETAVAVDVEPDNKLAPKDYMEYFGPDFTLHTDICKSFDPNEKRDLESIRNQLLDQINNLEPVPSIPFQTMPRVKEFSVKRVLYIDIDIHHADGVEEAFYTNNRVMTVSFHKFGNFFPGTGHIEDIGEESGKYYSLNVPLSDGLTDNSLRSIFRPIIQKVMDVYQPEAVVLQYGADSKAGDRLGSLNLSVQGHADCLRFLRSFNVPLMVMDGGVYTLRNVARCWSYETAAVDVEAKAVDKTPRNMPLRSKGKTSCKFSTHKSLDATRINWKFSINKLVARLFSTKLLVHSYTSNPVGHEVYSYGLDGTFSRIHQFPGSEIQGFQDLHFVGSVNGILLVVRHHDFSRFTFWNPSTGTTLELPPPNLEYDPGLHYPTRVGMGSVGGDLYVIRLLQRQDDEPGNAEMYLVSAGVWTAVGNFAGGILHEFSHVAYNRPYWSADPVNPGEESILTWFDGSDRRFHQEHYPWPTDDDFTGLGDVNGYLCALISGDSIEFSGLWMKYGEDPWFRKYTLQLGVVPENVIAIFGIHGEIIISEDRDINSIVINRVVEGRTHIEENLNIEGEMHPQHDIEAISYRETGIDPRRH